VDPAGDAEVSKGKKPDYNVVLTTAQDVYTGNKYVVRYDRARCNPSEMIDMIFNHVRLFKPIVVGIESVAYQNTIQHYVNLRMRKENLYFMVKSLTRSKSSKESRIRGLQPVIKSGGVFFRTYMKELITELIAFPLGSTDDIADALSDHLDLWRTTIVSKTAEKMTCEESPLAFDNVIKKFRETRDMNNMIGRDRLDFKPRNLSSWKPSKINVSFLETSLGVM
jgi:phage terminase large subunit-like protein